VATESITTQYIVSLREHLRERGVAYQDLDDFLATGADRLARNADVKTLQNLAARLTRQAEEVISCESSAQGSSVEINMLGKLTGLVVKDVLSGVSRTIWHPEIFDQETTARRLRRQNSFGTIMVCAGKGGLPDDIHIVSISRLARTHNRTESEIKREIWKRGERLFSLGHFRSIITALIEDVAEGNLHLPIPLGQLPVPLVIAQKVNVKLLPSVHVVPLLPSPQDPAPSKGPAYRVLRIDLPQTLEHTVHSCQVKCVGVELASTHPEQAHVY
jgi:hypothetical protein